MPEESSNYEIKIATKYDGSGAKAAQEDITKTSEAAATSGAVAPAGGGDVGAANAAVQQERFDQYAASVAAEDAREISAEQQKAILEQQRQILSLRSAQLMATINGDPTEVRQLQSVIAIRQNTLATLRMESMTQEELNGFLAEQVALERAASVAITERAAAEAEANAAAEAGRVHGRAGHLGHLAENFGLDSNYAISMGMGVMFGMEAYRLIQDATKELEKQSAEREKQGRELSEQLHKNHEDLENARSLSDVAAVRDRIEKELTDLHQKRWEIDLEGSAEEKESLDNRINALNNELRIAATWPAANLERKNAEELVTESIKAQTKALEDQLGKYKEEVQEIKDKLKFENELADLKLKQRLLQIQADEDSGKISHEQAAKQRASASGKADDEKFQREQAEKKEELDKVGTAKIFAENMASAHAAALASVKMHYATTQNQLQADALAQASQVDAKAATKAYAWYQEGGGALGGLDASKLETLRKAKEEAEHAAKESTKNILPANQSEKLNKDAESQKKQLEDLEKSRARFEKEAQAHAEDYAKKKVAYDAEVPRDNTLQQNRVVVRKMESQSKTSEAAERDQKERERKQKDAEQAAKSETPEQIEAEEERLRAGISTTAHNIHGQGSAQESSKVVELKRAIDSMAARLKEHPNDASAQNQLAQLIPSLVATLNQLATAQERNGAQDLQTQMTSLKAAQKRLEDQLKNLRTRH
jgi:hypothetical protein